MAARGGKVLLNCLLCSRQNNKFLGVITRQLIVSRAEIFKPSLRTESSSLVARSLSSAFSSATLSVSDADEKDDMPRVADSNLNESVTDNKVDDETEVHSSLATLDILDKDEKFEIPKAADSHVTTSVFDDEVVNKFVNCMMWDGKKSLSQKIFKMAMEEIKKDQLQRQRQSSKPDVIETDPLQIFLAAVENSKPVIGVRGTKKGGKVYQVPTPLTPQRRRFLAMKWLITAAREQQKNKNKNARMYKKLAKELIDAYNSEGTVIKKKQELHKRAEDNRAYAHFRWW